MIPTQSPIDTLLSKRLLEIDSIIRDNYPTEANLGVLNGLSGLSLFQFYYGRLTDSNENLEVGFDILQHCIALMEKGYNQPTFSTGITGFLWSAEHLHQQGFLDLEIDELLLDFDSFLSDHLDNCMTRGDFDFLSGGLGYLFYFLTRLKGTKNPELSKRYTNILRNGLIKLSNSSKSELEPHLWYSPVYFETSKKMVNDLGLAHGLAGIINLLSKLFCIQELQEVVEPMLNDAISFLIKHESKSSSNGSLFPNWISKGVKPVYNSRLAWCYGDLGIGISLYNASKNMEDSKLMEESIRILEHTAVKRSLNDSQVADSGLCHGAFGIAKIFKNIYLDTKKECFMNSSLSWMEIGLELGKHKDGYSGFKHWDAKNQLFENRTSLLEGISGIGLVIIDFLSQEKNNWDQCLLLS